MINLNLTRNKKIAYGLLITLIIFTILIGIISLNWFTSNNELYEERIFHIVFSHNLNEQIGNVEGENPDIQIDLTLTYPHGTLVVDDPVKITGLAIIKKNISQQINSSTIYFQNAQSYPYSTNNDNITKGQYLLIYKTKNDRYKLEGNTTVVWRLEGTYNPLIIIPYIDANGKPQNFVGISDDVCITVYPKEKLAQLTTNNVSMILAIVIFFLTIIGTLNLFFYLIDRDTTNNKNNKTNNQKNKVKNQKEKTRDINIKTKKDRDGNKS